jgi:hypothetical protein
MLGDIYGRRETSTYFKACRGCRRLGADAEASDVEMDGIVIGVRSLDHLLSMKRASERPRDRDDLESLEAAQQGNNPGS